ncbi:serine dehydratase [Oscillospiraceae bacterium]|nr:serine dehydratase [Oscillospiraceae bacterium]BDF74871.1 serine dehydratase [Oscillospiraceae bacterium]
MEIRYASIFNDALGPVTPGPSSSNTCGPIRIGRLCRRIFGEQPNSFTVEMSSQGSYPGSFLGMRSDLGFLTGVLDRPATHPRFLNAREDAAAAGIAFQYRYRDDLPGDPPELAVLTLASAEREMTFTGVSEGGGAFRIERINGCPTSLRGDCWELLLLCGPGVTPGGELRAAAEGLGRFTCTAGEGGTLLRVQSARPIPEEAAQRLSALCGPCLARVLPPESPVMFVEGAKPPFAAPAEFIVWQRARDVPLWRAAAAYEGALSGWTEEQVLDYADRVFSCVERSAAAGLQPGLDLAGIVSPRAAQVTGAFGGGKLLPLGVADFGAPAALAVMEYSNASGTIVCIPTGGASGVVPGALLGAGRAMGLDREELVKALLVAGLAGVFMAKTQYFGALGCQAEVGCAAGMAAAGLVSLLGGDGEQCCAAASMAIQSLLGLVCDPVGGLVQVPCFIRNMTGVSVAAVCANAAMVGLEHVVPLEEMVDAMLRVGEHIRCTKCNRLGAESTPTGLRLAEELKKRP